MLQVMLINFCLLHAHVVTKYMSSIVRTCSVICCVGEQAGPGGKAFVVQYDVAF